MRTTLATSRPRPIATRHLAHCIARIIAAQDLGCSDPLHDVGSKHPRLAVAQVGAPCGSTAWAGAGTGSGSWTVRGSTSNAIIASTQQPTMYQLTPVPEPVSCRILVAMSGAGPPAITEANW